MMLSKNKVSEISALHQKKHRLSTGFFIVEGEKIVDELLSSSWEIIDLYATTELVEKYTSRGPQIQLAEAHLFAKISTLKNPAGILAVVRQKLNDINHIELKDNFTLCLDGVRDPGNLGTIIRIADWFGIQNIICSTDTVDMYNSKTIQATMGSFLRVNVIYTSLTPFLNQAKAQQVPLFGAVLNGENVYDKKSVKQGIIIMGSESHGISDEVKDLIDEPITIPAKLLSNEQVGGEIDSLNVAIATSVICAVFAGKQL
jgi:TrmH family RNA methyltransferase